MLKWIELLLADRDERVRLERERANLDQGGLADAALSKRR
jgi:hypothetical protein